MNSIIKILLESTIILTAFYAIYLAFHANDKNFRFTRIYLISSSFLAIILPQMNIPIISEGSVARLTPVFIHDAVQLPEIIISDADPGITSAGVIFSPANIILSVYLIGFSYFLVKFLYEIFTLLFFIRNNKDKVEQKSFYKIVKTGGRIPTSSFFNYLFWDETMKFSQKEKEQIMRHEEGHISQFHSYDILYLELLRIVFWFNPFIHSYRRAIATVHEYLADAYVMDQNRDHQYLGLLARQVLRSCHLSLNNHFSKSQTIKRIKMINSDHRRSPLLRWGMSLAIVGIMFYFFACETNDTFNGINSVAKKFPHIGNTEIIIPAEIETASYRETVQEWIVKNTDRSHV
ncbi:MAG: hypothetical protein KFF73_04245, partial [Cyclobacteriaceae bacterium]|nr:hypothetical protein [Cyclobacteriaceae bacterium]